MTVYTCQHFAGISTVGVSPAGILSVGIWASLIFSLVIMPSQSTVAQQVKPAGGLDISEVEGKLEGVAGNMLRLQSEDGTHYMVMLAGNTTLAYDGTAEPEFLMPGLMVRFTAPFDAKGMPHGEVTELEIFRPAKQRRMSREQMQDQTPGIYPVSKENEDKDKKQDARSRRRRKPEPPLPAGVQKFRIVGQIRGVQDSKLQIAAGNRPVMIQLAKEPKIAVASGDTQFCMAGDAVSVSGLSNAAQPELIKAESIEIKGEQPLGKDIKQNPKDKKGTKENRSRPAKPNPR